MFRLMTLFAVLMVCSAPLRAEVAHVDNTALDRLLDAGVPIIDIRRSEEWDATGVIEGSHLLTFFDAQGNYDARAWLTKLSAIAVPDERVAIICHSGGRSSVVSRFLDEQVDFQRVFNVRKGIAEWIAEGRPTVSPAK